MIKTLFGSVLILFFTSTSFGQIDVLDGGNVGIGNLNPQYKLDVNGSINFTDSLLLNGIPFTFDGGGTYWVYDTITNSVISAQSIDVQGDINYSGQLLKDGIPVEFGSESLWSGDSTVASYGGHVGIGTDNPESKLQIENGNLKVVTNGGIEDGTHQIAEFYRTPAGIDNAGLSVGYRSDGSQVKNSYLYAPGARDFSIATFDGGLSDKLYIKSTGNIGIGTTNPNFKLDVDGDINLTGEIMKDGIPLEIGDGGSLWNGDSAVAYYSGRAFLGGGNGHRGGWSDLVIRDSDSESNSQLEFSSDSSSFAMSLYDNDRMSFYGNFNSSESPQDGWEEHMTIDLQNGNVGIGVVNPEYKLHVKGNRIMLQDDDDDNVGLSLRNSDGSNLATIASWQANGIGNKDFGIWDGQKGTTELIIDGDNGNVGIGTITPTSKLDVDGNVTFNNTTGQTILELTGANNRSFKTLVNGANSYMFTGGNGNIYLDARLTPDYSQFQLRTDGTVRSSGNYFINNSSPTIYLQDSDHNSGMIHMNSNLMYFLSGNGVNGASWTPNGSHWPLYINMTNDDLVFGGRALFMEGNVGIGTTSPSQKLEVQGNLNVNGLIMQNGQAVGGPKVSILKDVKPTGQDGQYCFQNQWNRRDLNELTGSTEFITLTNNEFQLNQGTYLITATITKEHDDRFRIFSVSQSQTALSDMSFERVRMGTLSGVLSVTASSELFILDHFCTDSAEIGEAIGVGLPETYSQIVITKLD